ncbi:MAG: hypothetical protein CMB80_11565 [Flammeovirgaceae bacterium]|nr:hypothetical protein [Flammeovirgaceae bacterium]MBR06689.1 hypothetical protein [Rickettsiales bacterium]MBR11393.1 hypothetical protein [Rickettsiales bacterium]HCX22181.1 hypothetical protein [Cytophagales bacterium]|tara:strand:- start:511 stop:1107 length:597 start_codon:yes stop_codon:yes gene_type:complete
MADKIKLEILGLSSSQSQSGSFALVLGEVGSSRRLPIIIGMFEAQAIAIEIEKITPNRPMTHDLFKSFAYNLGYDIKEIYISDLKEGVFFAKIVCESNGKEFEIDARPSDAIAIGLRFDVDIYTNESILTEAGIVLSDEEEEVTDVKQKYSESVKPEHVAKKMEDLPSDQLNKMLDEALAQEDYERAAKIRDEINRRN